MGLRKQPGLPSRYHREFYPIDMNGCILYLPFWMYGANVQKIWDQSGSGNHGTNSGAVPSLIASLSGVEKVTNGDMFAGNPPTGWSSSGDPDTFEQADRPFGPWGTNKCLHMVETGGGTPGFQGANLNFTTGKRYRVGFWYYLASGSFTAFTNGSEYSHVFSPTTTWTYFEFEFTRATGTTIAFLFESGNAELYITNISVQEVHGHRSIGHQFNGTSSYVYCPGLIAASQSEVSILLFGRISPSFNLPIVISDEDWTTFTYGITLAISDWTLGGIDVSICDEDQASYKWYSSSVDNITDGNFHQFGFTFGSGALKIYADGEEDLSTIVANDDVVGNIGVSGNQTIIGAMKKGGVIDYHSDGQIEEIIAFNRVLSAQEVKSHYLRSRSRI